MEAREQLRQLLKQRSFLYRPDKPFKLAAGGESPYYIDCRPVTHNARGLALIGGIVFEMVRGLKVQAVGGLTMGADPIAHAVAVTSFLKGEPINAFSVRKEAKEHGAGGLVVGDVRPGDRVVILEDVITTGRSTLQAVNGARDFGLEVARVIVLVDRGEGGRAAVQEVIPEVDAVFTVEDLKAV
jgi:orotate phosphoribosyltransferase